MDLARPIAPRHSEPQAKNPSDIRRSRVRIHRSQESLSVLRGERLPFEQETI
jgi:hypothetical protein